MPQYRALAQTESPILTLVRVRGYQMGIKKAEQMDHHIELWQYTRKIARFDLRARPLFRA
jgi:hypothetical protein